MKVRILNEGLLKEKIDKEYLSSESNIILGNLLGSGMFGKVYNAAVQTDSGWERMALKYVPGHSDGFSKERRNYKDIKKFVDLSSLGDDAKAKRVAKFLPIIYSVSEHNDDLYILMEKLIPLSPKEKKEFLGTINTLAMAYKDKSKQRMGDHLIDFIEDTDGKSLNFGRDRAYAIVRALSKVDEFKSLNDNQEQSVRHITKYNKDDGLGVKLLDSVKGDPMVAYHDTEALRVLQSVNKKFKFFFNGLVSLMDRAYAGSRDVFSDKYVAPMGISYLFSLIFAQKYPLQYKGEEEYSRFKSGYGQSSDIYNLDIKKNPIKEENPIPKKSYLLDPAKKYLFDPIVNAIKVLSKEYGINVLDLHNDNVMKRENGQYVFVDVGLFETYAMKEGRKRTKASIKVKIT